MGNLKTEVRIAEKSGFFKKPRIAKILKKLEEGEQRKKDPQSKLKALIEEELKI